MWRYYELLTDVSVSEIERLKSDAAAGRAHPMQLKKDLARKIVTDFHSTDAAQRAEEDWAKQFQKDEVPEDVESVTVPLSRIEYELNDDSPVPGMSFGPAQYWIKVDRLLVESGLAKSGTEAARKIKEQAVRIADSVVPGPRMCFSQKPTVLLVRVGRRLKRVVISGG
jgi:tyrosyl-tRNA synthetase